MWFDCVDNLVSQSQSAFFSDGALIEFECEPDDSCNADQESFKGLLSRALMVVAQLVPQQRDWVMSILKPSARFAALACSEGEDNGTCSLHWYQNRQDWDGHSSPAIQASALFTVQAPLVLSAAPPLTLSTGAQSELDPHDGRRSYDYNQPKMPPSSATDRGGGAFLTVLTCLLILNFVICLVFERPPWISRFCGGRRPDSTRDRPSSISSSPNRSFIINNTRTASNKTENNVTDATRNEKQGVTSSSQSVEARP